MHACVIVPVPSLGLPTRRTLRGGAEASARGLARPEVPSGSAYMAFDPELELHQCNDKLVAVHRSLSKCNAMNHGNRNCRRIGEVAAVSLGINLVLLFVLVVCWRSRPATPAGGPSRRKQALHDA